MEMQIAWIVTQIVLECNPHDVAGARSEQWRQIGIVVQEPGEREITEPNRTHGSGEHRIEDAILTANFRWLNQESSGLPVDAAGQ
jgi:hypothetical protein